MHAKYMVGVVMLCCNERIHLHPVYCKYGLSFHILTLFLPVAGPSCFSDYTLPFFQNSTQLYSPSSSLLS